MLGTGGIHAFRCRNVALTIVESLQAALIDSEVPTVQADVLDAHKAEQVRQHPAGWFYRHRVAVEATTIALLAFGTVGAALVGLLIHPAAGVALALTTLGFAIVQSSLSVRGPARWRERSIEDLSAVHPAIREGASRVQERLPGVRFRLGELVQDRAILDPYLIAEHGVEEVVLGIWDGEELVAPTCRRYSGRTETLGNA